MRGRIKTLKESFGFITPEAGGGDVFFHLKALKGAQFGTLTVGLTVEFEAQKTAKGFTATVVRVVAGAQPGGGEAVGQELEYRFLNPYNFVRILPAPGTPAAAEIGTGTALADALRKIGRGAQGAAPLSSDVRLLGRALPPPHDRFVGLRGRIVCEIETVSPLFVSDSEDVQGRPEDHRSYRFFRYGGQPALPASSLRGMLRGVFEALTNSCLSIFDGRRLTKRAAPGEARALWPARIVKVKGELALHILNGTSVFQASGPRQGDRLPAAWVYAYEPPLRPSPTLNHPPNRSTPYGRRSRMSGLVHGKPCWALIEEMDRPSRPGRGGRGMIEGFPFWNVVQIADNQAALSAAGAGQRQVEGWLCVTNQNIENKHDERFFFATGKVPSAVLIPPNVLKDYKDLLEDYRNRQQDEVARRRRAQRDPARAYPAGNGRPADTAFSNFILDRSSRVLKEGDLVYVRLSGSNSNPTVDYIVPVSVPRVTYAASLRDVLAKTAPHLLHCTEYDRLCPACRTFGWVREDAPNNDVARVASRGRLRFTHGRLTRAVGTPFPATLAILASPKPTTLSFYLDRRRASANQWSKPEIERGYDGDVSLRGRKVYRHHRQARSAEFRRVDDKRDDQNRTVRDALPPGNQFTFEIDFENLSDIELGALLWTLEMDGRGFHRLGFAKPIGFGSVRVVVKSMEVLSHEVRYSSLDDSGVRVIARQRRLDWVEGFKSALTRAHNVAAFEDLANVADLRALLGDPGDLPIHYPRPDHAPSADGKNFEWFVANKTVGHALPPATGDTGLRLLKK